MFVPQTKLWWIEEQFVALELILFKCFVIMTLQFFTCFAALINQREKNNLKLFDLFQHLSSLIILSDY